MEEIKKLLYLLQLEEYNTARYFDWLENNCIKDFYERKNHLKFTLRICLIFIFLILFSFYKDKKRAVGLANTIIAPLFSFIENFLVLIAKIKLSFYPKLTKIVITGSYGKTTFKEMLYWVLIDKYNTLSTPGNINTRIGIAQVILRKLNSKHRILIIEAGAYKKGEIKKICRMLTPDFGIITIIGWMHLERFKTIENIRSAKMELKAFIKNKNKFYYPREDHRLINFEETIIKIANHLEMSNDKVINRLKSFTNPENRLKEKKLKNKVVMIENNYSSNPLGFNKALKILTKKFKGWKKIIVTAGMIELGEKQFEQNKKSAEEAIKIADVLIIVGKTNKQALLTGAKNNNSEKKIVIWWPKEKNSDMEITRFISPPTVILKENDFLPDNYF